MQVHGQFEMEQVGRILICRPRGPFNLAGARAYEADFQARVQGLGSVTWAVLEDATEFEAAGPEVLAHFRGQFAWCAAHGCAYLAVVLSGHFKRYLAEQVFGALPFKAIHYTERVDEALGWLEQQLGAEPSGLTPA